MDSSARQAVATAELQGRGMAYRARNPLLGVVKMIRYSDWIINALIVFSVGAIGGYVLTALWVAFSV
jgi:hypothetical protein